jgi:uncharacterized membrane protein
MPFVPVALLGLVLLTAFLVAFIQVGLVGIAVDKLGLPPEGLFLLLGGSLLGSAINLPLFTIDADPPDRPPRSAFPGLLRPPRQPFRGKTVIAINAGGGLVPLGFSGYLLFHHHLAPASVLLAVAAVAAIAYLGSRPVPGMGVAMPVLLAPLAAALAALAIDAANGPPLAYIGGTLGVLLGADLLRLKDIRRLGTPQASIGGAGTFDGIFITGIVAVLLA